MILVLSGPFVLNLCLSAFSERLICFLYLCIYLEKRRAEAARIRDKYPDRVPVRIQPFLMNHPFFFLLASFFQIEAPQMNLMSIACEWIIWISYLPLHMKISFACLKYFYLYIYWTEESDWNSRVWSYGASICWFFFSPLYQTSFIFLPFWHMLMVVNTYCKNCSLWHFVVPHKDFGSIFLCTVWLGVFLILKHLWCSLHYFEETIWK